MIQHDQLIGLCDEISALARLNIPLEESLRIRSRSLPRKLGGRIRELAGDLESGRSLSEAIEKSSEFPPVYSAVIRSGLESGNLSGTLELVSHNLRLIRDSRRFLLRASLYPMLVFSILWILLCIVFLGIGPAYNNFFADASISFPLIERLVAWMERSECVFFLVLVSIVPAAWLIYGLWNYRASTSTLLTLKSPPGFFWLKTANRELAKATFARICLLLIRCGLPLPLAIALAAQAIGENKDAEPTLEKLSSATIDKASRSNHLIGFRAPLEKLSLWMLAVPDQKILLSGLEQYAEMSEFRARNSLDRLEIWFPVLMMFALGGIVLLAYFATIIFPYGYLLYRVAGFTA